jgi:hypothetical protein
MQKYRFSFAGDDVGSLHTTFSHEFEAVNHPAAFAEKDRYLNEEHTNGAYIPESMEIYLDGEWRSIPDHSAHMQPIQERLAAPCLGV